MTLMQRLDTDKPIKAVRLKLKIKAEITFKNPQRAITHGQSVVLYSKDICLGGGEIKEVY